MKQYGKPHICCICRLRVNIKVNNWQGVSKQIYFVIFLFSLTLQFKKIVSKSLSRSNSSFINPYTAHCFLKVFGKRKQFRCTGLLGSRKLIHLNKINLIFFYPKFSWQFNAPSVTFYNWQKGVKKWLDLNSPENHLYVTFHV